MITEIIETCPRCFNDLRDICICTYPPIRRKECPNCGWSWESERGDILRIPFQGDTNGNKELTYRST